MYLTKIELDASYRSIREARTDCQKLHRLLMGLFQSQRKEKDVLYRCREQGIRSTIYLYSSEPMNQERLLPGMSLVGERNLNQWLLTLESGRTMGFDLLTMPTKKVGEEGSKNSRRRVLRTPEERIEWMKRKAEQHGFILLNVTEGKAYRIQGRHDDSEGGCMYWDAYEYQGQLIIEDEDRFRKAVTGGIGPGKAYGLGMLLLR